MSSGEKLCPICDSPLQPGSKKCGFCGTDLSIFDVEIEQPKKPEPVTAPPPPPKASFEARVQEVLSRPSQQGRPEVREAPIPPPRSEPATETPSLSAETEPEPEPAQIEQPESSEPEITPERKAAPEERAAEEVNYFECPQCGTEIEATASSCPKCGVLFAEEGAEMFQCPACNTLVNIDAKSCSGCGAVFVEPEEEAPKAAPLAVSAAPVVEPPTEVPAPVAGVSAPKPEKAPEPEKKGFFGLFGKRKKEAEPVREVAEEKPVSKASPQKAPQMPVVAPIPTPQKFVETLTGGTKPEKPATAPPPAPAPAARAQVSGAPGPVVKDKGRDLARMVAEMKPLLALAREKEVDIGESKQLIDEAAIAGRERQIDRAIELVTKARAVLMAKIDADLSRTMGRLNDEIKVAREFGGDVSRANTYFQEISKARAAGDVEAAYVYVDKADKELQPITGRYNESRKKLANLKQFTADCEVFVVDTKDARRLLVEANKAFEAKDFEKVDSLVKSANDSLNKSIPARMNEEIKKARDELIEAKSRDVNITPMLTVLKSATNLMKSGDYAQAIREMREFREMMKKIK